MTRTASLLSRYQKNVFFLPVFEIQKFKSTQSSVQPVKHTKTDIVIKSQKVWPVLATTSISIPVYKSSPYQTLFNWHLRWSMDSCPPVNSIDNSIRFFQRLSKQRTSWHRWKFFDRILIASSFGTSRASWWVLTESS